jgi:branched-chain amino acid transport system permease protein
VVGLALGSIYAIASAALVVTYASTGILNFAFGSMAFFVALMYYWLVAEHGWGTIPAGIVSILVVGPLLGVFLWAVLFRALRNRSSIIKIVATIGLSVALPPVAYILFGNKPIPQAPGLAPQPVHVYHVFGTGINLNQVITYACVLVIVIGGTLVLRATDVGLRVRAMVDSEALTSLSGTNRSLVSVGVWAVSAALAGLAGILVAPTQGLSVGSMTALMAAAFAPVIAARLRSLPVAVIVALVMGLLTDVIQKYLPSGSTVSADIVSSIPFFFILVFVVYYVVRTGRVGEAITGAGPLDQAIEVQGDRVPQSPVGAALTTRGRWSPWRAAPLLPLAILALFPVIFSGFWLNLVAEGCALALVLLSYTLVAGEGGMIWLCQITFAGAGAIGGAQLATVYHWPAVPAAIVAAVIAVPFGMVVAVLTTRLGDLYVALVTLSFGLLVETLVFPVNRFYLAGLGVVFNRPGFASSDRAFSYLTLVVFAVIALLIINIRRSTTGLALSAARWSERGARTTGVRVVQVKVLVAGLAAFVAALGGAFLAMWQGSAQPPAFDVFTGLIWLAVLVTVGIRSVTAALLAGMLYTILPNVFTTYLPSSTVWTYLPPLLFGLGAVGVVSNPDGAVATQAAQLERLLIRVTRGRHEAGEAGEELAGAAAGETQSAQTAKKAPTP